MNPLALVSAAFSVVFFLVVVSYYVLLVWPRKLPRLRERFSSLTVIIPAHNEAPRIESAVRSVLSARFAGTKRVVVVDDGSTDATGAIVKRLLREPGSKGTLSLISLPHGGKSHAINTALAKTRSELVAIVDGDSTVAPDAFEQCVKLFWRKDVAGVSAAMRVRNRDTVLTEWLHIELLYASLVRSLYAKVNANITATGPLTVFRREALASVGGFSRQGLAEDVDVAVRLLKAGWRMEYATKAFADTVMPATLKGFVRQRVRFARGAVDIIKRHIAGDVRAFRIYTLPLFVFTYAQAVIMGVVTLANIVSGYVTYFASQGTYLNWYVVKYVLEWFSIVGTVRWIAGIVSGATPLTALTIVAVATTLLTYPLYFVAIIWFDRRVDWRNLLAVAFLFPFWLLVMLVYFGTVWEWARRDQPNIWTKESVQSPRHERQHAQTVVRGAGKAIRRRRPSPKA